MFALGDACDSLRSDVTHRAGDLDADTMHGWSGLLVADPDVTVWRPTPAVPNAISPPVTVPPMAMSMPVMVTVVVCRDERDGDRCDCRDERVRGHRESDHGARCGRASDRHARGRAHHDHDHRGHDVAVPTMTMTTVTVTMTTVAMSC